MICHVQQPRRLGRSLLAHKGFLDHTAAARVNRNLGGGIFDFSFVDQSLIEPSWRQLPLSVKALGLILLRSASLPFAEPPKLKRRRHTRLFSEKIIYIITLGHLTKQTQS